MANKKIEDLTALGTTFATADLFEVSRWTGSAFVSRKITGAEMSSTIPSSSLATDDQQINSSLVTRKILLGGSTNTDQVAIRNFADTISAFAVRGSGDILAGGATGSTTQNAIGGNVLIANTTGYQNNAFGANALKSNTTGYMNNAFGYQSLQSQAGAGFQNQAFGHKSGINVTTGKRNAFFGYESGLGITTGTDNLLLGRATGLSTSLTENVIINDGQQNQALRKDNNHNVIIGAEAAVATTATDGFVTTKETLQLTIDDVNTAPVLERMPDVVIDETDVVELRVEASDPEGDEVVILYEGWMDSNTKATTYNDAGTYTVTISASDGELTTSQDVVITVRDKNRAPTFVIPA